MSTTNFDWNEYEQPTEFPDRFKFDAPGQSIAGTITRIRVTDFGGTGEKTPELWLTKDDGAEVSITASQAFLRSALAEKKPQTGDRIAIVYTGNGQAKPGKSAPKLFDVQVKRAGDSAAAPATEQPVAAAASGPSAAELI